ncbi:SGNH/GDSL hydrolase family protein [Actinoplanes couchii]|uniref:SGNH/GDSL hydrolase family protein n=1 Tax=Actinoplanes couchii TaxID=403638 RepID=UPI0019422B80|nr:SGNH/GDSL hydrolase family protein [Actinoplanes couchii]MDR6321275.1 lysophospholipase L1-like esterase [Actinoplanes couchii]
MPARVGTWAAAPTAVPADKILTLTAQTVRQVVHTSVGGDLPRLTLSNEYGAEPVRIGAAGLAVRSGTGKSCDTVPGSGRPLTFDGATEVVIPPGATVTSDHVDMIVEAGSDLVISLYVPDRTVVGTVSPRSKQSNLIVGGDATEIDGPGTGKRVTRYLWITGLSVRTVRSAAAIAAIGDSITCGTETTDNTNHRWPDLLAARFRVERIPRGLLNVGLSGNRLLFGYEDRTGQAAEQASIGPAGLRRFERDVLGQPGVRYVVTLLGVNDLANNPLVTPAQLIAGHRELILRAKSAGLLVVGGTLLPFGTASAKYNNPANQIKRHTLNTWIRASGEYDAVVDFDAAVRDPAAPEQMQARYDSGDGLHPNDLGTAALATAVPLELFV